VYYEPTISGRQLYSDPIGKGCKQWRGQQRDGSRFGKLPAITQMIRDRALHDKGPGQIQHEMREWERTRDVWSLLFVAGRHYKLFVLITTQYAKAITPTLRGNTDYCFIMKTIQKGQREAMWEDFGDFLTKDAFAQILDAYTEDNEVLVIDTCAEHTVDPLEMLYWSISRISHERFRNSASHGKILGTYQRLCTANGPSSCCYYCSTSDSSCPVGSCGNAYPC